MTPDLDGARAVLEDFGRFWAEASDPEVRRALLQQLFERVWIDGHRIVAVRPPPPSPTSSSPERTTPPQPGRRCVNHGSDGGQTRISHPSGIEIRVNQRRALRYCDRVASTIDQPMQVGMA